MSTLTLVVEYFHATKIPDINEMILSDEYPDLFSADQIISISWDEHVGEYLVCYRVRRWLDE